MLRLLLFIAAFLFVGADIQPARAQYTIFDFFGQGPPRYREPSDLRERAYRNRYYYRGDQPQHEVSDASPKWTEAPKDAAAKTLLVIGDQYAAGLAQGLREAFAGDAMALIKPFAKEDTGLIKHEGSDWPQLAKEKIAAEKPAAVIVMIGLNDRDAFMENGRQVAFHSDRWRELYLARIDAMIAALKERSMPVYWVGLPIVRNRAAAGDIAYLNGLFREKAIAAGAKFVDAWEGFVDEDGAFMAIGPDVNGNTRRLRKGDGVGLSSAGNRKLAFYVEKEIRRDVVLETPGASAARQMIGGTEQGSPGDSALPSSYTGPVIPLNPEPAPRETSLLGSEIPEKKSNGEAVQTQIGQAAAKPGRLDDFAWPPETRQSLPAPPVKPASKTSSR